MFTHTLCSFYNMIIYTTQEEEMDIGDPMHTTATVTLTSLSPPVLVVHIEHNDLCIYMNC